MIKASVVIVTYNNEHHISNLLESLSYQSYKNFEVIIVDLCSTDKTLANAKPFPIKAFRLESKERSIPRALNLASKLCIGNIIFTLKGNNIPRNHFYISSGLKSFTQVETALTFGPKFKHNEAPIVKLFTFGPWNNINDDINIIGQNQIKDIQIDNFAYRKYVWQNNHFPEEEETAIWSWSYKIMELGYEIAFNPKMAVNIFDKVGLLSYFKEKEINYNKYRDFEKRRKRELSN